MLSKIEIESEYYKLQKYIIKKNEILNTSDKELTYLVDCNNRLRAVGLNPMTCKSLATFDKFFVSYLFTSPLAELSNWDIPRNECWKFKLNTGRMKWEENLLIYSKKELYNLVLTNEKSVILDNIHSRIDYLRSRSVKSLVGQEYVHISKYLESKEILQNNITEDLYLKYPYTTGYANVMGMTLLESAKAIALQHEIISGYLAESENLRLKYKKIILEENDISELKSIYENFFTEAERYGNL
jgi:hypothetical protein